MYNVTIKFDNQEDAAWLALMTEDAALGKVMGACQMGIVRDRLKKAQGVSVQRPNGQTVDGPELRRIVYGRA